MGKSLSIYITEKMAQGRDKLKFSAHDFIIFYGILASLFLFSVTFWSASPNGAHVCMSSSPNGAHVSNMNFEKSLSKQFVLRSVVTGILTFNHQY